jgi:DNA-binding response OmpR family regulator
MDGFEVARRLKKNPATHHIPIIMVTALDQPSDRVKGLEAGADDFLTKPVTDVALVSRVRSLVRLKMVTDELRMRAATSRDIGIAALADAAADVRISGNVLVVDDRASSRERIATALAAEHKVEVETDPQQALFRVAEGNFDLLMVSLELKGSDALRLVGQVRTVERTRHLPILLITEGGARACCAASISGPTTTSCARSTATNCSRACGLKCAADATPSSCATTCSSPWSLRSPIRSPGCSTGATWSGISARWSKNRPAAARRSRC